MIAGMTGAMIAETTVKASITAGGAIAGAVDAGADAADVIEAAVNKAVASKSRFELEHRVLRRDGTLGWIVSRAVPIFNTAGEISEWVGTATSATASSH